MTLRRQDNSLTRPVRGWCFQVAKIFVTSLITQPRSCPRGEEIMPTGAQKGTEWEEMVLEHGEDIPSRESRLGEVQVNERWWLRWGPAHQATGGYRSVATRQNPRRKYWDTIWKCGDTAAHSRTPVLGGLESSVDNCLHWVIQGLRKLFRYWTQSSFVPF